MKVKNFIYLFLIIFFVNILLPTFIDARRGGGGGGFGGRSSSGGGRSWSSSRSSWSSSGSYYSSGGGGSVIGGLISLSLIGLFFLVPLGFTAYTGIKRYIYNFKRYPKEYLKKLTKVLVKVGLNLSLIFSTFFLIGLVGTFELKAGFLIQLLIMLLSIYFIVVINRKARKNSLVSFQFGFYLGKGALIDEVKRIIENCDVNKISSLHQMFCSIGDLIISNKDLIRWYGFSIEKYRSENELENAFNSKSQEERAKYDKEEFLNIEGKKIEKSGSEDNLEEIFVISIIAGFFTNIEQIGLTLDNTLDLLKFCENIVIDNFGGVSVWYNIMDREELIETYPEIKSVG